MNISENYMTWSEVTKTVNRSKTTVWRWIKNKSFPAPKYRKKDGLFIGFKREEIEYYCKTGEVKVSN